MRSTKYTFSTRFVVSLFITVAWMVFGSIFLFSREPDNSLQSVVSRANRVIAIVHAGDPNYWWVISEPSSAVGVEPTAQINYMPAWDRPKETEESFSSASTALDLQEWQLFDTWRKESCRKRQDKTEPPKEAFYTVAIRCTGYTDIYTTILLQEEIPLDIFNILSKIRTQSIIPLK